MAFTAVAFAHPSPQNPQIDLGYEIHQGHFNVPQSHYLPFQPSLINPLTHHQQATGQFYNFSNIRYAAPPLGNLRFAPPAHPPLTAKKVFNDGSRVAICPNAVPAWGTVATKWLTEGLGAIDVGAGYTIPNITAAPTPPPGTSEDCLFLDVLVPKAIFERGRNGKGAPVYVFPPHSFLHLD